ncbi:hypothetical protein Tco_0486009, partial [Tanacetum coccineum]
MRSSTPRTLIPLRPNLGVLQIGIKSQGYKEPGPEEPQSPPLLDYVPEPIYPEYMPQEDEVFPAEEQPLPAAASPTTQSSDYVLESDPEADPEEDDDEDPDEDPVNY